MIRLCTPEDAAGICAIYNPYIDETVITFEEAPVAVEDMAQRIGKIISDYPWLVLEEGDCILGYAYAGPYGKRSAYRYSVETTVYLDEAAQGKGLGTVLYRDLLERLQTMGIHIAIGAIALPNAASVALHEKLGFHKVGELPEVGRKFDRWVNVGYWAKTFVTLDTTG